MSRTLLSLILTAVAALGLSGAAAAGPSSWPQSGHDAQSSNFNPDERILSAATVPRVRRVWSRPGVIQAVATESRVYGVTSGGSGASLLVLDARSGRLIHAYTTRALRLPNGDTFYGLAYAQGRLVVAATRVVLALNPDSGHVYWRTPGGALGLIVAGDRVYTGKGCQFPCGPTASYALDLRTGRVIWRHPGNFGAPPVLLGGRLYQTWGENRGETRVYDPGSGRLAGRLNLFGWWTGDAGSTYLETTLNPLSSSAQDWLERVDAAGRLSWRVRLGLVAGPDFPVYAYHMLFAASNRFHPGLVGIDAANGKVKWGADLGSGLSLIAANHLVYALHQSTGRVDVLSAADGRDVARLAVGPGSGGGSSGLMVAAGTLYVISGGQLTALR